MLCILTLYTLTLYTLVMCRTIVADGKPKVDDEIEMIIHPSVNGG
ncbi:Uncharacterised protein [Yersinia wautersii]|uniref:Lipoprotein n=1 Tax=Yersinia wautersii TaxID=1341643 RepID=A0ABM9TE35_9GAMM|nr:Uncharacterised protein [Yersinia wautersii]